MIKKIVKKIIESTGYTIQKKSIVKNIPKPPQPKPTVYIPPAQDFGMNTALKRCIDKGLEVNSVIDIGASDGRWTRQCLNFYKDANYLLIEAQEPHKKDLEEMKKISPKIDYTLAAAGGKLGKIYFNNEQLLGGVASETAFSENNIEVPVTTVDHEIKNRNLKGPFLIKLDTHGFEVPILEGAEEALKNTNILVIEVYNFKIGDKALRFWDFCKYMEEKGFLPVDMVDLLLREKDNCLWQMDMFFIRKDRKEFSYNGYF